MGASIEPEGRSRRAAASDAEWLARALEQLNAGLVVMDHPSQKILRANDAAARIMGERSGEDLAGRSALTFYADPKERAEIAARLMANEEFRRTGRARLQVRRVRQDTHELVEMTLSIAAVFDAAGQVQRMDVLMLPADNPGLHERAFRQSEERFRVLFEMNSAAMALSDLDGHLTRVNAEFCRFTGRAEGALRGEKVFSLFLDEDRPDRPDPGRNCRGGSIGERRFLRPDGQVIWGQVSWSWLCDDSGAPHSAVIVIQDVTQRKKAEQSQLRIAKLESLGLLAGGIAHDFKNLLGVVLNFVALADKYGTFPDEVRAVLADASQAARQAADLSQRLVGFGRGGAPMKTVGSVAPLLRDVAGLCLHGSDARLDLRVDPALWLSEFDPVQLHQVLANLLINAVQAMPGGGTIHLEARNREVSPSHGLPLTPGRYLCISVTDQGEGIAPDHLDRIFDPYFTTRPGGTGLGLATAHAIVIRHGGHLAVESTPERGSTFRVYLPAADAA